MRCCRWWATVKFAEYSTWLKYTVGRKCPRGSKWQTPGRYFHQQLTMLALGLLAAPVVLWQVPYPQIFPEISPISFRTTLGGRGPTQTDVSFQAFLVLWPCYVVSSDGFVHHWAQRGLLAPFSSDWQERTAGGNSPPNRCSECWYLGRRFDLSLSMWCVKLSCRSLDQ